MSRRHDHFFGVPRVVDGPLFLPSTTSSFDAPPVAQPTQINNNDDNNNNNHNNNDNNNNNNNNNTDNNDNNNGHNGNNQNTAQRQNGNPIHQSSSDNLTHQQPSSGNLAQFIRMLGNLSPADRQTLASALSSSPSPETDSDPYLSTKPAVKTLEPYDRLEEWLPSFKQRDEFFNHTKTRELEDYADVKQFHRVQHLEYAAPPLTSSRNVNVHKNVYKRDQGMAIIQARLTHLTRPIDAKRDKKIIPQADPNDKTPLITHQQFIDQGKFTHSLRKASGHVRRGRGRGRGRGGFNNLGNRNGQQNNNFDNSLENSGNNGNNGEV
ncbi:hypothetical protein F5H01DRAFT_372116 [Linnemannia elongata]|nr:hypothetical protein F5H01DRAFT_372116 [Linnemannia elongata]